MYYGLTKFIALYLPQIKLLGNQICAYLSHVSTHTYGCSKEPVQVFSQKLLAVIFLLREISYGLVILSGDFVT